MWWGERPHDSGARRRVYFPARPRPVTAHLVALSDVTLSSAVRRAEVSVFVGTRRGRQNPLLRLLQLPEVSFTFLAPGPPSSDAPSQPLLPCHVAVAD